MDRNYINIITAPSPLFGIWRLANSGWCVTGMKGEFF